MVGAVRAPVAVVVHVVGAVDLGQAVEILRAVRIVTVDVQITVVVETVEADLDGTESQCLDSDVVEVEVHELAGRVLLVVVGPDRDHMGARRQRDVDRDHTTGKAVLPDATADLHHEVVRTVTHEDAVHGNEQLAAFIGFVRCVEVQDVGKADAHGVRHSRQRERRFVSARHTRHGEGIHPPETDSHAAVTAPPDAVLSGRIGRVACPTESMVCKTEAPGSAIEVLREE